LSSDEDVESIVAYYTKVFFVKKRSGSPLRRLVFLFIWFSSYLYQNMADQQAPANHMHGKDVCVGERASIFSMVLSGAGLD
jgi:hypothetical protein